jgi:hypothetical protein
MAGSKAVAVVLGVGALAGIGALAFGAKAAAAPGHGTNGKTAGQPQPRAGGATNVSTPTSPVTIPSGIPGVPPVTIKPGDPEWLANELALHLTTLQLMTGGVGPARGKENKQLVKAFQQAAGFKKPDALAGPATLIAVARRGTGTLPLVMYWPKNANDKTVATYRTALRAIAADAPAAVAEQLRASIEREQGQGLGVVNRTRMIDLPATAISR